MAARRPLWRRTLRLGEGGFLVSDGAFYRPFAWDRETLEGRKLELTVTLRGDGYEGRKSVNIVLE
ncbi:hypothetical protein [Sorangium sp. So ce1151]|uniref:hypothetical protein n=1 Tax=Sorangium sp. So ce1151 TaxID=3133332 RepID=UPI003F5F3196